MRKSPLIIHKPQPKLRSLMQRAGLNILDIADFWNVAPSTARQRLSGLSGVTPEDIIRATVYCEQRIHPEKQSGQSEKLISTLEDATNGRR